MRAVWFVGLALAVLAIAVAYASDEENYVSGYEEAFEQLRFEHSPGTRARTVEEAIAKFYYGGEVDKGTYPASEIWERDGDLRRKKPEQLRYSGRTYFKYSDDNISGVEKWEKELELNLSYDDWSSYFRFSDVNVFAYENEPMRWQKARLKYRGDDVKVTLGNVGAVFGRGLALNMYEDRILEFDNEVEGLKVEYEAGDADITGLWGTRKEFLDRHHSEVAALRVEAPLTDEVDLGVHAVNIQFPDPLVSPDGVNMFDYDIYGTDLAFKAGDLRFFGEAVQVNREEVDFGTPWDFDGKKGTGHYLSATYNGDGYSLTTEYKNYNGLFQPFAILPPVRKYNEQSKAEPEDDKGYAVELNWNPFRDGSLFKFNYGQGNHHGFRDGYTEFIASYSSPATGSTSWVGEYLHVHVNSANQDIERLSVNHQLNNRWSAGTFLEREHYSFSGADGYYDYIIEGELSYKSVFTMVYVNEMTESDVDGDSRWQLYEFRIRPSDDEEINISSGARREGFVCSGGVCRVEPAFDGFKIDYLRRF